MLPAGKTVAPERGVQDRSVVGRADEAHEGVERHGDLLGARCSGQGLEELSGLVTRRPRVAGAGRLDKHQSAHEVGAVTGQRHRDKRARGVTDHVCMFDAEMVEERRAQTAVVVDRHPMIRSPASGVAGASDSDHSEPGERLVGGNGDEPVREHAAETIYSSLGGKRGLLEGVIDAAVVGPAGVPHEQQPEFAGIRSLPTARDRLRAYVAASCGVLAGTSAVHAVIRGAADGEAFAIALRERQLQTRLANNVDHLRAYVGDALRPGLSLRDAAQRYCALSSPELHHLLTVELGWSARRHERWLADLTESELLAD